MRNYDLGSNILERQLQKKKKGRSKLVLFEEAVMLCASETLSQEVTLVPPIIIL